METDSIFIAMGIGHRAEGGEQRAKSNGQLSLVIGQWAESKEQRAGGRTVDSPLMRPVFKAKVWYSFEIDGVSCQ